MKKKTFLIIANALIVVAMVLYALYYSFALIEASAEREKESFVSTMEAMERVATNYMQSSQRISDDWAKLVESRNLTMEEAMKYLGDANTESGVCIQLIRDSDLTGLSSVAKTQNASDYTVEYTEAYGTLYTTLKKYAEGGTNGGINITRNYNNPSNGNFVVAFCSSVRLVGEDGTAYGALLMRLEPRADIMEHWVFPVGFEGAQIAMIDSNGDYIIRSTSLKSENFYEFIRAFNGLTYRESYALREKINSEAGGGLEYLDAGGAETYYAYTHMDGGNGWIMVGTIPMAMLKTARPQWSLFLVTCIACLALLIMDGAYFYGLQKRLTESLAEAERANRAKTDFLSAMSHDIRTPMNAIVGLNAIAQKCIDDRDEVQDCLKKTELASNQLLTLINDVLDISRVESGKLKMSPAVFSLPELTHELVGIMYPQILEKGLRFSVSTENIVWEHLYSDVLRINQIWTNILSNAVKYTNSGGAVAMTIREEPLPAAAGKVSLIYAVEDTGIGMSEEFLKTIFDPFTRAADSRTAGIQGSGLGMAITKQMVDLLDGTITIDSSPGHGSVFRVTLTLPIAEGSERADADGTALKGAAVLIADRNGRVAAEAAEMLAASGAEAVGTETGAQAEEAAALRRLDGKNFDVVIADSELEGLDALAKAVRADGTRTMLLLSAYDATGMRGAAARTGAAGIAEKPFFISKIRKAVGDALGGETGGQDAAREKRYDGLSVLVAEDNDLNWEIIEKLMGFYGIKALRAENGRECVDMIKQSGEGWYSMVFMDIHMPVMDGYEAAREIRGLENKEKAAIPIIAMTADAFAEDIENCMRAGMNGHIPKPVAVGEVLAAVDKYCGKKERGDNGK